jgi:N-acetylneuraminic acid mutarotase
MIRIVVLSFVFASIELVASEGGDWQDHRPLMLARQEHGAACIGRTVYVAGGLLSNPTRATNDVEAYDIESDSWSPVTPMPAALDHLGVVALNDELHVIGGFGGDFRARAETYIYNPNTHQWRDGKPLPEPRGACWAVSLGGKIYVFGGVGAQGDSRSTFAFDPIANEWSSGRDMPTAREHLTAAAHGEFIYVIGGRASGQGSMQVNERYHPATDDWQTMAPMPTARSAMGVATLGDRIVVAGGETPRLFAESEIYHIASNSWSCSQEMPIARHGLSAVALADRILFPAGGVVQGLRPTNEMDSFIPAALFLRGDANQNASVDIVDALHVLFFLVLGDEFGDVSCLDALDANDNGSLGIDDGVFILWVLFLAGPAFAQPFPDCGEDATEDSLDCQSFVGCEIP